MLAGDLALWLHRAGQWTPDVPPPEVFWEFPPMPDPHMIQEPVRDRMSLS